MSERPPPQRRSNPPTTPAASVQHRVSPRLEGRPTPSAAVRATEQRRSAPGTTPQEAAVYDSVVVPRWSALFGRALVARVPQGMRGQVLDVGCGTGHPALDVMRRLGDGGRVIAIDRDPALVDLARRRAFGDAGKRIFFKVGPIERLSFGDEVFDLVVGNLVIGAVDDEGAVLDEIRRVLVPGGRVLLTRPMSGTFEEVLDMYREIAVRRDLSELSRRIEHIALHTPSPAAWRTQIAGAGFEAIDLQVNEFRLSFRSAREMFNDPMLRVVAMPEWRWICGIQPNDETLLEEVERSLDTYFGGGPISLTVRAGLIDATKPL